MDFTAETFQHAEEFLKSERLYSTSCLVADMQMPGMIGLELYHQLVGSGTVTLTILIAACPDDTDRARALRAGVFCHLSKDENELQACIRLALADSKPTWRSRP